VRFDSGDVSLRFVSAPDSPALETTSNVSVDRTPVVWDGGEARLLVKTSPMKMSAARHALAIILFARQQVFSFRFAIFKSPLVGLRVAGSSRWPCPLPIEPQ
jgi:hypothetical protein